MLRNVLNCERKSATGEFSVVQAARIVPTIRNISIIFSGAGNFIRTEDRQTMNARNV